MESIVLSYITLVTAMFIGVSMLGDVVAFTIEPGVAPLDRCRLNGSRNKSDSNMLSPEDQDDLCHANSLFFAAQKSDNKKAGAVEHTNAAELDLSSPPKHIKYNTWPRSRKGRELKKKAMRPYMHSVEIRILQGDHPLAGQLGLFSAKKFQQFDIIGEYCGEVFDSEGGGEYATYLEDRSGKYALGVNAASEGNESRFINHYKGIQEEPNVILKIAFIEELPRVMVVCLRDIEVGKELLLSYSAEYVQEYLGI